MAKLASRKRPPPRRATPRRSERERDPDYLAFVKTLPCFLRLQVPVGWFPCEGVIEADHMGRRPLGRKADDKTAGPLCTRHHRERTDWSGAFKEFTKEDMRAFLSDAQEFALERWKARGK